MPDIPADIIEAAARFDAAYPLRPELADLPFRVKFWGRDEQALADRLGAGPDADHGGFGTSMDGRLIISAVAEIHLPDGRRHLLVYDDLHHEVTGTAFIWHEGNWSCDCNRALDLHHAGVRDLGFPLDDRGEPEAPCTPPGSNRPSLRLGWLVLRHRHLVTGAVRFEIVDQGA